MGRAVFEKTIVLEVGTGSIAASFAGMILADNGARVIKVEPPGGDHLREWNPGGFLVWNRGKESVCIDLESQEGRERFRSLAANADVLIDGLAAGTMRKWELEYEELSRLNDQLIYCAIRGFSEQGPYSHIRAYEGVLAAKVGFFNRGMFAYRDEPEYLNAPVISSSAGYLTLGSVSAALLARETIGVGQRLEVSMYTAANAFDPGASPSFQYRKTHQVADVGAPAVGGRNRYILWGCTADNRWFVFFNMRPYQAQALVRALGREEILEDPKFKDIPWFDNEHDAEDFEMLVMEAIRAIDGDELVKRMRSTEDVAFEELRTTKSAFEHPQVIHNRIAVEVDDERLGRIREIGPVAEFSETPSVIAASAPQLDQNRLQSDPPAAVRGPEPTGTLEAPLAGLTILEFGHYYAMPYGLALAASLGARVIKLEGTNADPWRQLQGGEPEVASSTCVAGKESVALDLRSDEGREIFTRLVGKADAFVYSLRTDPDSIGMGYDDLRAIKPDLIYVNRPGYGSTGPYAGRPMYASTADALAGMFKRKYAYWLEPERCEPAGVLELKLIQVARINSGILMFGDGHGANAIFAMTMMALLAKARFGVGQYVESSMINAAIYPLADEFLEGAEGLESPRVDDDGELFGSSALYRLYKAADRWVFVAAPTDKAWARLAEAMARKDLLEDPRLSSAEGRRAADAYLVAEIGRAIETKSAAAWEDELNSVGVGCAIADGPPVQEFTSTDAGLRESGLTFPVEHPTLGTIIRAGAAASFSATPGVIKAGTVYGQNTESILSELGYSDEEIDDFVTRGVAISNPIRSAV